MDGDPVGAREFRFSAAGGDSVRAGRPWRRCPCGSRPPCARAGRLSCSPPGPCRSTTGTRPSLQLAPGPARRRTALAAGLQRRRRMRKGRRWWRSRETRTLPTAPWRRRRRRRRKRRVMEVAGRPIRRRLKLRRRGGRRRPAPRNATRDGVTPAPTALKRCFSLSSSFSSLFVPRHV